MSESKQSPESKQSVVNSIAQLETEPAKLADLDRGSRGRVKQLLGDKGLCLRLQALGFCPGREIEVLRADGAWVVRVLGSRIGLSRSLAESVLMNAA